MSTVTVESLKLSEILPSSTNPRKSFDPVALEQLAQSIKEIGITVPILVRPFEDQVDWKTQYELVSGHRRLKAAAIAGLETIPAFIRELSDAEALDIQMVENLQRADLHPMDEAAGYQQLLDASADRGIALTQEELAHKVGKPLSYVAQRIKLLEAIPIVQKTFADGLINIGHALVLARLQPEMQEKGLRQVFDPLGYKGRGKTIEQLVDDLVAGTKPDPEYPDGDEYLTPIDTLASPVSKLKQWVEDNVTLELRYAPWSLGDAHLVEAAGSCVGCEKRTGSNPALFAEFTTGGDSCMDPACFGEKKKAFVRITLKAAEKQGKPLPKLTDSWGQDKLDGSEKVIKKGQWVEAEEGSCPSATKALMTKGENTGSILTVCVNQKCKVHKHAVYEATPRSSHSSEPKPPKGMTQEQFRAQKEREANRKQVEQEALYLAIRKAYAEQVNEDEAKLQFIERALDNENCEDSSFVMQINGWKECSNWQDDLKVFRKKVRSLDGKEFVSFLFDLMYAGLWDSDSWRDFTKDLNELAKKYGVDAAVVKQKVVYDNPTLYDEPKVEPTKPAKKAAKKTAKKTAAKKTSKPSAVVDRKSAAAGDDDDDLPDFDAAMDDDMETDEEAGVCSGCGEPLSDCECE